MVELLQLDATVAEINDSLLLVVRAMRLVVPFFSTPSSKEQKGMRTHTYIYRHK